MACNYQEGSPAPEETEKGESDTSITVVQELHRGSAEGGQVCTKNQQVQPASLRDLHRQMQRSSEIPPTLHTSSGRRPHSLRQRPPDWETASTVTQSDSWTVVPWLKERDLRYIMHILLLIVNYTYVILHYQAILHLLPLLLSCVCVYIYFPFDSICTLTWLCRFILHVSF